jgi:transcriptional regulator with XRE-family HTH domain
MLNSTLFQNLREQKGVSQDYIAKLLGLSRPSYSLVEKGEKELTISQAQKLCDFFEISFTAFVNGEIAPLTSITIDDRSDEVAEEQIIRISVPQEKVDVFKEVLLYVLNKVGGQHNVGQTVIYKLLYFIDFDYYEKYEKQLIGAKYIHNHYGPTPVAFTQIVQDMKASEEIEEITSQYFQYEQRKYLPLREPNLSLIDGNAVQHINEVLNRLGNKTASELTELSHKDVPWITAQHGEFLDYEAVFYRTSETSVKAGDDGSDV